MKLALRVSIIAVACTVLTHAHAAESDVHFGLTKFLALQAGYEAGQAEAIALGDQRVESGDMQYVALVFDYACLGHDTELAQEVAVRSFPSNARAPGPPEQRVVAAGGEVSWKEAHSLDDVKPSQGGFLLYKLGQALHVLQASFSHQGIPDTPQMAPFFTCDPALAWAHPRGRGGWNSHAADLTLRWPAETVAMAKATYDALLRFPAIGTVQRKPQEWDKVRPLLDGFIKAATKAEKQAWFVAQGFTDTAFLAGITLRDGARPFELEWGGRRLPKLPALQSRQHDTDPAVLDFFSGFFVDWLSTQNFDALAAAHAAPVAKKRAGVQAEPIVAIDKAELAARLRLWRIRDHGAVAELAHARERLSPRQLSTLSGLARTPSVLVTYANPADAVFPLVTNDKDASPLLPFIVRKAPASATGNARAVAIAKLRHAPYDTVGVVAENIEGSWKIVAILAAVDH